MNVQIGIIHKMITLRNFIIEILRFLLLLLLLFFFVCLFVCLNSASRHLGSHLAMQRLSSEATTSYPNKDAPGLPEHDQRGLYCFINGVVITKSSIDM